MIKNLGHIFPNFQFSWNSPKKFPEKFPDPENPGVFGVADHESDIGFSI
jgi:hypothetical protein